MSRHKISGQNFRRSSKAILSFWLVVSLICIYASLPENALASQKIPKNLAEKLKHINKMKLSATTLSVIKDGLKTSLAEAKLNSKISGGLGSIIKAKTKASMQKMGAFQKAEIAAVPVQLERIDVIFELSLEGIDLDKLASRGIRIKKQYMNLIEF